jgi:2-methylisocitrate lyase-like PEP mutase family enzyme
MQQQTPGLKELISRTTPVLAPLVLDPLSARMAEAEGFEAFYLGGGTLGYVKTVTEANLSLTQMAQTGVEIRAATALPLILDGQCGWGDPMHVRHTIAMSEAAGFAAIELEDQLMPKRAHHHIGIEHLIPIDLMTAKIRVAVETRRNADFLIIGRTNACRTDTVDEALRRAEAYRKAGADMLLILPRTPEQARAVGERIEGPLLYMMMGGIGSIGMTMPELGDLGYRLVIDALTPFYARTRALKLAYAALAKGVADPTVGEEFRAEDHHIHDAIGLEGLLAIEKQTVES